MARQNKLKKLGVTPIQPEAIQFGYVSPHKGMPYLGDEIASKSQYGQDFLNKNVLSDGFKFDPAVDPMTRVETRGLSLFETQRALASKPESFVFWDTETLGNSLFSMQGQDRKPDLLEVPQISLQRYKKGASGLELESALNIATGISSDSEQVLRRKVNELKKNPLTWSSYDNDKKRSLIDLMLYSNSENFKEETVGEKVIKIITGQETQRPSVDASPQEIVNHISRMEKGLKNLTDEKLVNTRENSLYAINNFVRNEDTMVGYNSINFDRPVVNEFFGKSLAGTPFDNALNKNNNIDVYSLSRFSLQNRMDYNQRNTTLESVYSHLFGNQVQTHLASDDVQMTAKVFESLSETYSVNSLTKQPDVRDVNPSSIYVAQRGIQANPNQFNRGENTYSFNYRLNPETKKFEVAQKSYQANPIVRNTEYSILGRSEAGEINGIKQYVFALQDLTADTTNLIFTPDKNYLNNQFLEGTFVARNKMSKEQLEYFGLDTARRTYERLVSGDMSYANDDVIGRIDRAYRNIDEFDKRLLGTNMSPKSITDQNKIISDMYKERLSNWQKNGSVGSPPSLPQIRDSVRMAPLLKQERDVWGSVIERANKEMPVQDSKDFKTFFQRAQLVKTTNQKVQANYSITKPTRIAREGQELFQIQSSVLGEFNYLDVTNRKVYNSSIDRLLKTRPGEGQGQVLNKLNVLLDSFEAENSNMFSPIRAEILHSVNKDMQKYGEITQGTINSISGRTYGILEQSPHKVNGVNASITQARFKGAYAEDAYVSQLKPYTSQFVNSLVDDAFNQSLQQTQGLSIGNDITLSKDMLERIQKSHTALDRSRDHIMASQRIYGLDQGEIGRSTMAKSFKDVDIQKQITQTIEAYQNENFDVALFFNKNRNTMELAYSLKEERLNLGNYSVADLYSDNRVGVQVLPLMNEGYGIDTNSASIASSYTATRKGIVPDGDISFVSKVETSFDIVRKTPQQIRRDLKNARTSGQEVSIPDIIERAQSRTNARMTDGEVFLRHGRVFDSLDSKEVISGQRALTLSGRINTDRLAETYMKREYPEVYSRWEDYALRNRGSNIYKSSDFWRQEKKYSGLDSSRLAIQTALDLNEQKGIRLTTSGLSVEDFSSGIMSLNNPQASNAFGLLDSNRRETGPKSENFIEMKRSDIESRLYDKFAQEYAHLSYDPELMNARIEAAVSRRLTDNTVMGYSTYNDELLKSRDRTVGVNVRTMMTNDIELSKSINVAKQDLNNEIRALQQEQLSMPAKSSDYKRIGFEIEKLQNQSAQLDNVSAHEGQAMMRKSLADSMVTDYKREIIVPKDEIIPDSLIKLIAEETGVDYTPGMDIGLREGETFDFTTRSYLDKDGLKQLGLIDENGLLRVGQKYNYEDLLTGQELSGSIVNQKRVSDGVVLEGLTRKNGNLVLLLHEKEAMKNNGKIMGQGGLGRYGVQVLDDEIFDKLKIASDLILENTNLGKENPGAHIAIAINTVQENILSNLDKIDFSRLNSLDDLNSNTLQGVRKTIEDMVAGGASLQDINPNDVFNKSFLDIMGGLNLRADGPSPSFKYNADTGMYDVVQNPNISGIVGVEGQKNLRSFFEVAREDFGFSEDSLSVPIVTHNTLNYAGTGIRARDGFREIEVENITNAEWYEPGQRSAYQERLDLIRSRNQPDSYREYSQRLSDAMSMERLGTTAEMARQEGSLIVDMTGSRNFGKNSNYIIDDNGRVIVDGLSLDRNPPKNQYTNTVADTHSIRLYSDADDALDVTNVGEYLAGGENRRAFLQTQVEGSEVLTKDYVPLVGRIEDRAVRFGEESNIREMDKQTQRMFEAAYDINHGNTLDGYIDGEPIIDRAKRQFNQANSEWSNQSERFFTSGRRGSFPKQITSSTSSIGDTFKIITGNQTVYELEDSTMIGGRRHSDIFQSRETVAKTIRGKEDGFLIANQITEEMVEQSGKSKLDYILDALEQPIEGDDSFEIFANLKRNPVQGTGNIQTASVRINPTLSEDGMQTSPGMAAQLRADFDGDQGTLDFDIYRTDISEGNLEEELVRVQKDLRYRAEKTAERNLEFFPDSMDNINPSPFEAMLESDNVGFLKPRNTILEQVEDSVVGNVKARYIGQTDNLKQKATELTNTVLDSAVQHGGMGAEEARRLQRNLNDTLDPLVQNMISAKKMSAESIGLEAGFNSTQLAEQSQAFLSDYDTILGYLKNPRKQNEGSFIENLLKYDLVEEDNVGAVREMYQTISMASQVAEDAGFGGMVDDSLNIGLSSGSTNNKLVSNIIDGDFDRVLPTSTASTYVKALNPEAFEEYKNQANESAKNLSDIVSRYTKETPSGNTFEGAAANQLSELTRLSQNTKAHNSMKENLSMNKTIQSGFRRTVNSNAFRMGAGLAAAWIVGSAVKGGPTPEGEEAEQIATMAEVSPASLLTSPTARVTPRGENINMSISGTGAMDPQELAGIINQQIGHQTGIAMDLNINQTDNVQNLDNKFFEDRVSQALGIY